MNLFKKYSFYLIGLSFWLFAACEPFEEDMESLDAPPTSADVSFEITEDPSNPNILILKSTTAGGFIAQWDLGNGAIAKGLEVRASYPLKGEYLINLTINTAGGQASASRVVTIAETNFEMLETPDFINLTGGVSNAAGKTWVIDSTTYGHLALGPVEAPLPQWYWAQPLEKASEGLYNDEFVFKLTGFEFDWVTEGDIYSQNAHVEDFGGTPDGNDQRLSPVNGSTGLSWAFSEDSDGTKRLTLNGGAFMGFYTGVSSYEILELSENRMYVRFLDSRTPAFAWYHRLIVAGFTPPSADFESSVDQFTATFTNNSTGATQYEWDFGDGNTSMEENPSHTYAEDGTYQVTLKASNDSGDEASVTNSVIISNVAFSQEVLTGGSSKTWKLKLGAGTYGVGASPGDLGFYPQGNDISGERPCVWNDEYTFTSAGAFTLDTKGDFFSESYYQSGVADGCNDTAILDGQNAIWGDATNAYTFIPAQGETNAKIQLDGLGAFIGLAKAYDGGEFTSVPTEYNYTVTYEVISYTNNTDGESMTIAINVGGAFWTFVLEAI